MLSKIWKKVGLIILIIACLWNIVYKLVVKISFDDAIQNAKQRIEQIKANNNNSKNNKKAANTKNK